MMSLASKGYTIYVPTKIVFGTGTVNTIGEEVKVIGAKKIILITDKSLSKLKVTDSVLKPLDNSSASVDVYDNLEAEPNRDSLRKAVEFVRNGNYDMVVGLGGGTCMDTSKLAAACATNPGDPVEYVDPTRDKFQKDSLPTIMIPTTSGTGSEVDNAAVLILDGYKTLAMSYRLFPRVAIVDPAMTLGCPPRLTAGCGMDALSHFIDCTLSFDINPIRHSLALEGIRLVSNNLRRAYYFGTDMEARANLSMAAMMGGIVMNMAETGYPTHSFAEVFGPSHGVAHGVSCGLALPYLMDFYIPTCSDRLSQIAAAMGEPPGEKSQYERAADAVKATLRLLRDLELPMSLREINVSESELSPMARKIKETTHTAYGLERLSPRRMAVKDIETILHRMWNGFI